MTSNKVLAEESIQAIGDFVAVTYPLIAEGQTESGLYTVQVDMPMLFKSEVCSVGKDVENIVAGDYVLFVVRSAYIYKHNNAATAFIREKDILAVVK